MKNVIKTFDFNGTGIQFSADGWINATATAKDLGKDRLDNFLISSAFTEYAQVVAEANSLDFSDLQNAKRGGKNTIGAGTFLHPELAVVFARWISPAFAYWCDKQVGALIRKAQAAPALAQEARTRKMIRLGRPANAIVARNEGVCSRRVFTDQLQRSGVGVKGFSDCTRAVYAPLFGGSTGVIKKNYGLPEAANVRDYMSAVQLASVSLTELLSAERIEKQRDYGINACVETCNKVAKGVAQLLVLNKRGLSI